MIANLGRFSALLAVVAGALGSAVTCSPAAAAPTKPTVSLEHIRLTPDRTGQNQFVGLRRAGAAVTLHDVVVEVDGGDISHFATVLPFLSDDRCTATGARLTCRLGESRISQGYAALISLWVKGLDSAAVGDTGTLTTTVTSREFGAVVRRSTVTVAEPVAMEPGGFLDRDVRPGQRVGLPLTLRNTGNRPITSTVMWFYREAMYQYPQSFKNCGYGRERIVCRFDDDVPPGATYRLSEPFAVTVRKQVPAPGTIGQSFSWSTPADAQNALEDFGAERPRNGTGSVLRLVPLRGAAPAPTPRQGVPQSTGSIFDPAQSVFFKLTGRNVADLAAIGADARGKRGKTITVKVGAKNLGPAFIFGITKPAAAVVVSRPKGTTVVSVPTGCLPSSKGRVVPKKDPRGAAEYRCATTVNPFEAGKQITWAFKLRIDKKGALTGGVRVVSSTVDGKRTNDSAKLRINPPAKKK